MASALGQTCDEFTNRLGLVAGWFEFALKLELRGTHASISNGKEFACGSSQQ